MAGRSHVGVARVPKPGCARQWGTQGLASQCSLPADARRLLAATGRPGDGVPEQPWAVVVAGEQGEVAAAVCTSFVGGLFWAWGADGLLFGDNVRELVAVLAPQVSLDPDFIRRYATIPYGVPSSATPFREIHRIKPGTTARWGSAQVRFSAPATIEWCGPQSWAAPTVEGSGTLERYRATFDAGVDGLLAPGPIYTQMSGGLDSTFVAASLVRHATPDNPVHALCHSPLPQASLQSVSGWDPDDYPVASAMAEAYPGRLVVHQVFAEPGAHPLDAAAEASHATGVPTFNPGNQMWLNHFAQIAAEAGAAQLFCGTNGNAAFSYHHNYAPGYYLARGRPLAAWRSIAPDRTGMPDRSAIKSRVAAPLARAVRRRPAGGDYHRLVGLGHLGAQPSAGIATRAQYLKWLSGAGPLQTAGMFSGSQVPIVDAFTTRAILDLAAAITPLEWSRGPGSRGYARLLGAGRVPDAIRLRTRRGGQAWDEWYIIRNDRDRYDDEVAALSATPILGGWVDDDVLRTQLASWPWGEVVAPSRLSVVAMNRILSLAAFVRSASVWCRG